MIDSRGNIGKMYLRKLSAFLCCSLIVVGSLMGILSTVSAQTYQPEIGDFWEYKAEGIDIDDMEVNISYRITVEEIEQMEVSGFTEDIYVINITGNGEFHGVFFNLSATGDIIIEGIEKRLESNFSIISTKLTMSVQPIGFVDDEDVYTPISATTKYVYEPPLDDFVGDNGLGDDLRIESRSIVNETMSARNYFISNYSNNISEVTLTLEVVETNVNVTTPAGTFHDCYRVHSVWGHSGEIFTETRYYSDEVGNYVKIEGGAQNLFGLPAEELVLVSYSFSGQSSTSDTSDNATLILALAVSAFAIVAIIVILLLLFKIKKLKG